MKKNLFLLILSFWMVLGSSLQAQKMVNQVKLVDFQLQSSAIIHQNGEELSSGNYNSPDYWFPVKIPSTVLTGLVRNHIYPDPYQGLNNMLIPDASDFFNKKYHLESYSFLPNNPNPWKKPYWYRTHFFVSSSDRGKTFQLIFKGINYRAAVWLNGKPIADSTQMAGMFSEYNLEVSKQIITGTDNYLAVKIYPLDYPGLPSEEQLKALGPFFDNGGPTGDIGKNVTMLCSAGWDWMPPVRDRNMGIWQPVYLRTTGQITIGRPQIKTYLPRIPDTSIAGTSLGLSLSNHKGTSVDGELKITICPENFIGGPPISFSKNIHIEASGTKKIELDPNTQKELLFHNPHLWWPNNYGKANLYRIRIQFIHHSEILDDTSFAFGIRTTESKTSEVNGFTRREFFINGKKVHLVGGAWVPDMMLNRDSTRYDAELHLCRNANVNLVRIWGGGITPPDAFFDIADKYGLLIWSDFWVTGDTQGEFKGSPDWPLESSVFIKNVISTILRIRNHPSLLLWTGGNEGHARKELYDAMRNHVIGLDGTRPFIPSSSGFAKLPAGWKGSYPEDAPSGVYSGGPYSWQDPKEYYKLVDEGKGWVFKDETGIPSQPPYNSLSKIIPNLVWDTTLPYPLNNTWGYHDAASGNGHYELYYDEMVKRFGKPTSMEDFSNKMQILNAIGYQGIFESANHKINETGGVMLWKLNAALPSVIWQVYDWYLEPNAGYYFMQNACEPVHVQLNLNDSTVALINRTQNPITEYLIETKIFNSDSKLIYSKSLKAHLAGTRALELNSIGSILKNNNGISFIILNIRDLNGNSISHNAYWISSDNNFKGLLNLPKAVLKTTIIKSENTLKNQDYTLKIINTSDHIAFFVRPQFMNLDEEVLPSFWSASYFTLAPKEEIHIHLSAGIHMKNHPSFSISGLNIPKEILPIKP